MSSADFDTEHRGYDDEARGYDRDGSPRSPRGDVRSGGDSRARSASPDGRGDNRAPLDNKDDEGATNSGSNLFVTGIHPRLSETDVQHLFEKFGDVEKCNIMRDPHSGDSRGFGFVKMVTAESADAARDALQGVVHEGRTLSIEKARRSRPRTPTPGKYYGPPKRSGFGGGRPRGGGGRYDDRRYDDTRGGYGRRDDYYGSGNGYRGSKYGGGDRYEDRGEGGYDRKYRDRGDYGRPDRYGSGGQREDRYGGRDDRYGGREERRGGYYGREDRGNASYDQAPRESREAYSGGRGYDDHSKGA